MRSHVKTYEKCKIALQQQQTVRQYSPHPRTSPRRYVSPARLRDFDEQQVGVRKKAQHKHFLQPCTSSALSPMSRLPATHQNRVESSTSSVAVPSDRASLVDVFAIGHRAGSISLDEMTPTKSASTQGERLAKELNALRFANVTFPRQNTFHRISPSIAERGESTTPTGTIKRQQKDPNKLHHNPKSPPPSQCVYFPSTHSHTNINTAPRHR